ncbi:MAG: outer membrane lipoprotein chaperone LolA [Gammaproteobacteria bacterium]
MKRMIAILVGVCSIAVALGIGVANADAQRVTQYFQALQSLRAEFVQTVFDDKGKVMQVARGEMWMQKPGRFRWNYQEPYEQVIVADGTRLWVYDKDLEQVTVKRIDAALSETPLALLSGAAPIGKEFTIGAARKQGGLEWYELRPKKEQSEFSLLRVGFDGDALRTIELEDALKQRTRLSLEKLERNISVDSKQFQFVPPPGVDVAGDLS